MPRRAVQTIEQERAPAPPLVDDFFTQEDNVSRLLVEQAGSAADAIVKVYKCGGPNSQGGRGVPTIRDAWLYQCPPHEFDEELLQSGYGPGKYRIRMYGTHQDGSYGSLLNKILEVGPVPPWQRAAAEARLNGNSSGSVTVNAGSSDIAKAMADALAPLIGAMAGMMKQEPGASRKEMLEEIRAIGEIMRPQADPLGSLGGLKAVMELAKSFSGSGDAGALTEESGPYAVLMKALETFGTMMQAAREQGASLAAQPALPAPAPAPAKANGGAGAPTAQASAQPAAAAPVNEEDERMKTFFQMQLALFLNAAKANGNPEIYAGLIVENAPERLLDMMEAANWWEELVKLAPDFAAHKPWCEQVRNIAMEALKDTAEEPQPAAPATPEKADS